MSTKLEFSEPESQLLRFAPFWTFHGVAGMDSKVDEPELAAFRRLLKGAAKLPAGLARDVLQTIDNDYDAVLAEWNADPRSTPDGLAAFAGLLGTRRAPDLTQYAEVLLAIGLGAARASGGGFTGPVGVRERAALSGTASRFGVDSAAGERWLKVLES